VKLMDIIKKGGVFATIVHLAKEIKKEKDKKELKKLLDKKKALEKSFKKRMDSPVGDGMTLSDLLQKDYEKFKKQGK